MRDKREKKSIKDDKGKKHDRISQRKIKMTIVYVLCHMQLEKCSNVTMSILGMKS